MLDTSIRAGRWAILAFAAFAAIHSPEARAFSLADLHLEVVQSELPQNTVHSIIQSRDGYLWIATYEGVVRTDGVSYTVFDRQSTNGGLGASGVLDLHEDRSGAIWFGTFLGGVSRYRAGKWSHWGPDEGFDGQFVRSIREDGDGKIWVGTNAGLFTIANERVERVGDARLTGAVRRLETTPEGDVVIGYEDGRLVRVTPKGDVTDYSSLLPGAGVFAIAAQPGGTIWAGTDGAGLFRIAGGQVTKFGPAEGLTSTKIRSLMLDPDGAIWIGTEGGGLDLLSNGKVDALRASNGLPTEIIRAILRDREGTVWLGTNGGGLVALKRKKFSLYTTRRGMSSDAVRVILESRDGSIWIGTDGGGVNVVRDGRITVVGREQGLPSEFARSLLETRDGTIWIGTVGGGLASWRDGKVRRFAGSLPSDTILALAEAPDGAIWVGTNRGLAEVRKGAVVRVLDRASGLSDNNINAVQVDVRGRVWAGTASGLYIVDGERIETVPLEGALHRSIFCIKLESDGSAWIGSNGGLSLLREDRIFEFGAANGVPEDGIFQILEDRVGFFWLTGNRGITKLSRAALEKVARDGRGRAEAEHYGRADGMQTNQCNGASQPAGWAARDGGLWFPTPWGAVRADLLHMPLNQQPPPIVVERVRVDGVVVPLGAAGLDLKAGRHRIEVDFAAMSFIAPDAVRFRTRLEGLDEQWVDRGSRRNEIYTNIGPGSYRFRVIAANNDGVWNEQGAGFDVVVRPFFWQKPAFLMLAALVLAVVLWGILMTRTRHLVAHRRELQELVAQRTEELEKANAQLQYLSATDSLTGTANRRRFDEALDAEWRRAIRSNTELSILMIDVDQFKQYNDDYGHQQGDVCLRLIAGALGVAARRAGDIVARYGGDEFAVILPGTPLAYALAIAENTRLEVESLGVRCKSGLQVTVSIGVATAKPDDSMQVAALVATADEALYRAKSAGGDRVESGVTTPSSPVA
jgi:diguanylate cyclase (GGDEF)-like protein